MRLPPDGWAEPGVGPWAIGNVNHCRLGGGEPSAYHNVFGAYPVWPKHIVDQILPIRGKYVRGVHHTNGCMVCAWATCKCMNYGVAARARYAPRGTYKRVF